MWRALLSGEKCGEDMLRPSDYVKAAGQTLSETGSLARQLVSRVPSRPPWSSCCSPAVSR